MTNARTRFSHHKKPRSNLGFTLMEMLVAMVIMAVLMAAGIPSLTTFIATMNLKTTNDGIVQGIQQARAEAIRTNSRVNFVIAHDTSWTVAADSGATIESKVAHEGSGGVILDFTPAAATTITFNSMGRAVPNLDGSTTLMQIDISGSNTATTRRIKLIGGMVSGCDPSITDTADPRKC